MSTTLFLGPPGTGKTTTLLNLVDDYLSSGGIVEKIGFISFTKKAVNEAVDRAAERFCIGKKHFLYFRTIHSLCFMQLGMSKNEVMSREHYRDFGHVVGMSVSGYQRQDQMMYELPEGDQLAFLESLARLMCLPLEEAWRQIENDVDFHKLDYFRRSYEEFKKVNMLYDFTDMLVNFNDRGVVPELDLLIVDEAQDLCKLQWEIIEKLSKKAARIYIAGDDDQAIFRWSGADIEYFLSLSKRYETKVLTQSYRLPKKVFEISNSLVKQIQNRNEKSFLPTASAGKAEIVGDIERIPLEVGEWLILVRNTYMMEDVIKYLMAMGFPYRTNTYSSQEDPALKAAFAWERLRAGGTVGHKEARDVLSFMRGNKTIAGDKDSAFTMKDICQAIGRDLSKVIWHDALDRIPVEDREYYIAARGRGEALNRTPRIKVSTIHGAKGGECANVVVFTDLSLRTFKAMQMNYEDEVRVFYVAVTRAKERLYIVQPRSPNCFLI